LSLVGAPVIGSKVLSATPDGVNHLTSLRRAKLSHCNTLEDDMPSSAVFKLSMNQQFGFIDLIGKDYTLYDTGLTKC